jgi:hypothetical protein
LRYHSASAITVDRTFPQIAKRLGDALAGNFLDKLPAWMIDDKAMMATGSMSGCGATMQST